MKRSLSNSGLGRLTYRFFFSNHNLTLVFVIQLVCMFTCCNHNYDICSMLETFEGHLKLIQSHSHI